MYLCRSTKRFGLHIAGFRLRLFHYNKFLFLDLPKESVPSFKIPRTIFLARHRMITCILTPQLRYRNNNSVLCVRYLIPWNAFVWGTIRRWVHNYVRHIHTKLILPRKHLWLMSVKEYCGLTILVFNPSMCPIFWFWRLHSIKNVFFSYFTIYQDWVGKNFHFHIKKILNSKKTFKNVQNMHSDEWKIFIQFKKIKIYEIDFKFHKITY